MSDLRFSTSRAFSALLAITVLAACAGDAADSAQNKAATPAQQTANASAYNDSVADAVADSLRRIATADSLSALAAADSAQAKAAGDSTKPPVKKKAGMLGPSANQQHMAYRDAGSDLDSLWPPKMPAPMPGSILPNKRIIAYYGNPLSKRMGILGEYEVEDMLRKLDAEVAEWNKLDPSHPVQPALHLIAVVAQGAPGRDGKYRLRMDSSLIEKVYGWAKRKNAIMFIDIQVGQSTLQQELPYFERFLKRPEVHLGIDPEFSMKDNSVPGKKIGTFDAADINYATGYLNSLVDKYKIPPKILVIHRFTRKGVTNYKSIKLDPRSQIVMHMDGFGAPWLKRDSFYSYIKKEPVQFAGWKQFSKPKNDSPPTSRESILRLWPTVLYIQIQ